ncbi:MarR family transcriptional regulator [Martelella alba]|uniref:MarR family transcriptional regulator n=1 Tax=Martelella alba TaxID=2590451 RepID=A0A506UB36_9HYPH|nr:MarR family transcriptional regulator [Martelella alba]TPW30586.1 MarR family transcriptional regulator [Martelella alba]
MDDKTDGPLAEESLFSLAENLRRAVGGFVRKVRAEAGTPGSARVETLALLDGFGAMSTSDLARHRGVKHQSMRLVVGELETEGLLIRSPSPSDGRRQLLSLSEEGRLVLEGARASRSEWIAGALAMHLDAEERRVMREAAALLERITRG